jgi:hypothetical protein
MQVQGLDLYVQSRERNVQTIRSAFVQQIKPAKGATRIEETDKRFSAAFEKTRAL